MKVKMPPGYWDWMATRPECVRKLAEEFPVGTEIELEDGPIMFVIGWNEDDMLIVSPIWPGNDYEGSIEARQYLCASHCRDDA